MLLAEGGDDLVGLVLPHHPVIDEDAGEAVSDRTVDEQRGGGRVDTAGEAADRLRLADLRPDLLDLVLDHRCGRPLLAAAADIAEEPGQNLGAVRRVDDLGVELDPVEGALGVLDGGHRRLRARGERGESGRRLIDRVPVAHPALLLGGQPVEQAASAVAERQPAATELARRRLLHPTAELVDHQLHPVTDAEHGDAEFEQLRAERGRPVGVDRGGAAGEHKPLRAALGDPLDVDVMWKQLAEDPALPDTARDQLRVLAAEVEDEDFLGDLDGGGLVDRTKLRLGARNGPLGNVDPSLGVIRSGGGRLSHR